MNSDQPSAQVTLRSLFTGAPDRFGDRAAIVHDGLTLTYAELAEQSNRLAHALQKLDVGPGAAVALGMPNRIEYLIADQGLIRCGAAKVPLNDLLSAREIGYILRDSGSVVAIVDAEMLPAVLEANAPTLREVIVVGGEDEPVPGTSVWHEVLAEVVGTGGPPAVSASPDDIGLIIYTGGTTGQQKGVVHTQRGLAVNLLAHLIEMGLLDDERLLLSSPLPHSAGFFAQAGLLKGAVLFLERRFDPDRVLDRIQQDRITATFMVPTMIYRLLDQATVREVDLSSLRSVFYGAAPITLDRLEQGLRMLGPVFAQLYGQTEAPNFITRLRREDHDPAHPARLASCGQAAMLMEVAVQDTDGNQVPPGQPGEIVARGPYVMAGYHNLPDKTAETLRGGWLHTGDLGQIDADGYVCLLDRKNDMIITGGMNVYSTEVENVIAEFADVGQVAVVGITHPDWGEAVVAFVAPLPGRELDDAALIAHCRRELAAYKRPKAVRCMEVLPVTAYGKTDKKTLRAEWPGW